MIQTKAADSRVLTDNFEAGTNLKTEVITFMKALQHDPSDRTLRTLLLLSRKMLQVILRKRPNANIVRENAAYIAIKSLFRTALQELIDWGTTRAPDESVVEVCEDTWNL